MYFVISFLVMKAFANSHEIYHHKDVAYHKANQLLGRVKPMDKEFVK